MTAPSKPLLYLRRLRQQLWFRPAVWSLLAVAATAISYSADSWRDDAWAPALAPGLVDDLLRILATSMLAVSTFALSVLVSAFASAAESGTPRATQLVVASPGAQKPVAVFLASFIFSIVGVIALGAGEWGAQARFVLFVFVLVMVCWVIYAFMQYIQVLTRIGRVGHTIETVEKAARDALLTHARNPTGGARSLDEAPLGATPLRASDMGFLQFIDFAALERACLAHGCSAHVEVRAGDFVHRETVLLRATTNEPLADGFERDVRAAFVVGRTRTIEQDANYGLIVLAEIAQRALSPAVNDPGTAIAVLASQTQLILESARELPSPNRKRLTRVSVTATDVGGVVELAFDPIARAAGTMVEVQHQILERLHGIVRCAPGPIAQAARRQAALSLERARVVGLPAHDLRALESDYDAWFNESAARRSSHVVQTGG